MSSAPGEPAPPTRDAAAAPDTAPTRDTAPVLDPAGGVDPAAVAPDASDVPWRRLSPRMLAVHPLRTLRDLLPMLLPVVVVGSRGGTDAGDVVVNLASALLVLALATARWLTTRYRVTDRQVQLRTGVLQRQTLTMPLDRVRTVDLQAGPVQRILGLTAAVIGSGAHASRHPLALDGLTVADAEALRVALLHRSPVAREPGAAPDGAGGAVPVAGATAAEAELVRLHPSWVRYAPLSTLGLVTALGVVGLATQAVRALGVDEAMYGALDAGLARLGLVLGVVVPAVALLGVVVLGGVVRYVLAFWGHRVTRHGAGTLRVTRGLLTTRSTTVEEARVRGVVLGEPLPLRLAGGATLDVVVAGVATDEPQAVGGDTLLPASPRAVGAALAAQVLGVDALAVPLVGHGPRAARRRWSRALQVAGVVTLACLAPVLAWGWPVYTLAPAVVAVLAVPLAADRARGLGHALTGRHLVAREGSLARTTTVLDVDGVLGWDVRSSVLQRRAGLVTLTALTAAGTGGYRVLDVPADEADRLVAATAARVLGVPTAGGGTRRP